MAALTSEQQALIPYYREKWRKITLSTEPVDREKATAAVKAAYAAIGFQEPEIIFCESPYAACQRLALEPREKLAVGLLEHMIFELWFKNNNAIYDSIDVKFGRGLREELYSQLETGLRENERWATIWNQLEAQMEQDSGEKLRSCLQEKLWVEQALGFFKDQPEEIQIANYIGANQYAKQCSHFDFYKELLNGDADACQDWEVFYDLVQNCGWIFPYQQICLVCDRPRIVSLDEDALLHAEAAPAMEFADGFSIYTYHGIRLPEKYGKVPPDEWRSQWLLSEENAQLRMVLIQAIGYDRICHELQAVTIDSWQEYELLALNSEIDIEPINLLKMVCPSTGKIHVLRVPPEINSAQSAIKWVNWDIDPLDFGSQT